MTTIRLGQLVAECAMVQGARVLAGGDAAVAGVAHDSREVQPGDLFVCLVGGTHDGHRHAAAAVGAGAVAVAVQAGREAAVPPGLPAIVVENTRAALPFLAACVFGHPSRLLKLVGVTGTNGKTTTVHMAAAIFRTHGWPTGVIGTLGAELDGEELASERTTPEGSRLQALFSTMRQRGANAVVMEVSSHALAQGRTDGSEWDGAVFTNLTQDHLDFHGDMETYLGAKLRLFRDYPAHGSKPFVAAVNVDDPYGERVAAAVRGRVIRFGAHGEVRAEDVRVEPAALRYTLCCGGARAPVHLGVGGAFQVANSLGAAAVAVGLGVPLETAAAGLGTLHSVPGRFEPVPTGRGFHVVVDYAHTPDGLANLLQAARRLEPRRLIVVFGCGGDRDATKRPLMGAVAARLADVAVVTSDNPRTEDPAAIIEAILPGARQGPARVLVEPDRRAAIALGLEEARAGDIMLIAGKGHETYQEVCGVQHPFDDRVVARELLQEMAP